MINRILLLAAWLLPLAMGARSLPGWIPQRGQFLDENGQQASLLARWESGGVCIEVFPNAYSISFFAPLNPFPVSGTRTLSPDSTIRYQAQKMTVRFQNGQAQSHEFQHPLSFTQNWDLTNRTHIHTPLYEHLCLKNVWPGIDILFYPDAQQKLKYDIIVHPGGRLSDIEWRFEGQSQFDWSKQEFTLTCSLGQLKETLGSIYTRSGQTIAGNWRQQPGRGLQLQTDSYPAGETLVIDPGISWSTYYGSPDIESLTSMRALSDGSVIACGFSNGAGFPVLNAFQSVISAAFDGVIFRLDPNGIPVWSTYFGGAGDDRIQALDVSPNGDVLIGGETSDVIPVSVGAFQTSNQGGRDAFVGSFNPNGIRNWSTQFGGSSDDYGYAVVYDAQNLLYLAGGTLSSDLPVFNGFQQTKAGASGTMDGFLVQISISGQPGWGTFLGGNLDDIVYAACADPFGRVVVAGGTGSLNFPQFNSTQTFAGNTDCFVSQFNSFGQLQWSTLAGGSGVDMALSVDADSLGAIFAGGYSRSTDFPVSTGAWQTSSGGSEDMVVLRYDGAGQRIWSTYLGGSDADRLLSLSTQPTGKLLLGGYTEGNQFPALNGYQNSSQGQDDGLVLWMNDDGTLAYSTYLGGAAGDYVYAVAGLNDTLSFAGGLTSSTNFPVWSAWQSTNAGSSQNPATQDIFISRLCLSTARLSGTQTICAGNATLSVQFSGAGPWEVEYSDGSSTQTVTGITQNPWPLSVTPSGSTTYSLIRAWDTQGCGAGWVSGQAVVSVVPNLPAVQFSGNDTLCPGSNGLIQAQFSGSGPWNMVYSDGTLNFSINGISVNPFTFSVTPGSNTTYSPISCQSACGTGSVSGLATFFLSSSTLPTASASGTYSLCPGAVDSIPIVLTGGGPWELSWTDGTQNFTQTGITYSPFFIPIVGTNGIQWQPTQILNNCGAGTASGMALVNTLSLPVAGFSWVADTFRVQFTDTGNQAQNWNWSFGDAFFSTNQNPQHTYLNAGTYLVTLIASNSCGSDTLSQWVTVQIPPDTGTSVLPLQPESRWSLFPNPSGAGEVYLAYPDNHSPSGIQIWDNSGKELKLDWEIIEPGKIRLSLRNLPRGIYAVELPDFGKKLLIHSPDNP